MPTSAITSSFTLNHQTALSCFSSSSPSSFSSVPLTTKSKKKLITPTPDTYIPNVNYQFHYHLVWPQRPQPTIYVVITAVDWFGTMICSQAVRWSMTLTESDSQSQYFTLPHQFQVDSLGVLGIPPGMTIIVGHSYLFLGIPTHS